MADSYYKSSYYGTDVDEQITYVKNVAKKKIPDHDTRIENLEADKANSVDVVKYSEKNVANGYAGLDASGKVPVSALPDDSFTTVEDNLNSSSTTNALSAKQGKTLSDIKQNEWLATTGGSGTAFTVTLNPAPTSLYVGMHITIIPHVSSTSTSATLNVNGLGAKQFKVRGYTSGTLYTPYANRFLSRDKPVELVYDGSYWVLTEYSKAYWEDIYNIPSTFNPTSHASSGTTYGVGTTSNYGHVKTINDLTKTSYVNGEALSAYQGKVLSDRIDDIKTTIESVPTQNGGLIYNGEKQRPAWNNYDPKKLAIGGDITKIDAGTYTATFTPESGYQWEDGSTTAKSATWSIRKASNYLTIDKTEVALNESTLTATITADYLGDGALYAISSNTSVAKAEVDGKTVTITATGNGTTDIEVGVDTGTNYKESNYYNITVTADNIVSPILAENSPSTIQMVARSGQASNIWSVGDKIGIPLSGTMYEVTFSDTYYAYIIGFNHNPDIEGKNSIHFQFGKTADGSKNITFIDRYYNTYGTSVAFRMKTSNTNTGGWRGSLLSSGSVAFFNKLPEEWQNVIAECTKYSDNSGGNGNVASNVTATANKIWLLAEFEVFGKNTSANSAEQNYQQQYEYFANGNSRVKYGHTNMSSAYSWWLRSVAKYSATNFCFVNEDGLIAQSGAYVSRGFAPGFMVA